MQPIDFRNEVIRLFLFFMYPRVGRIRFLSGENGTGCLGLVPKFAYCPNGVAWFQETGRWKGRDYVPVSGDIIFFDFDGDGVTEHVGIVEKVEDGMIYTVEGNYEDECCKSNYVNTSAGILGYGSLDVYK